MLQIIPHSEFQDFETLNFVGPTLFNTIGQVREYLDFTFREQLLEI